MVCGIAVHLDGQGGRVVAVPVQAGIEESPSFAGQDAR